ncbi:MAG: S9 family peptidase [Prevotellaceae bacterium]|jgi:dipeptidyl aminopeptidase/acylaminoacyl peptidase|nr:S9 family peptidase [Prevotellaceae bacterium]
MQRIKFCAAMALAALSACSNQKADSVFRITNQLTQEEKQRGILTPEILWKFGQVSDPQISPDGGQIVYCVKRYNLSANRGVTSLYLIPSNGEATPVKLTDEQGSESNPRWSADGKTIRFISDRSGTEQIWEIAPADKKHVAKQLSDVKDGITAFAFSPKDNMLLYVKKVQVSKTLAERYPDLPKANVRIIDDLMYRHWNTWNDGSYHHVFVAGFSFGTLVGEKDINEGEAWDTPRATGFDVSDICWDAEGRYIYYASKKMTGKEYALSTNSDIYRYDTETGITTNLTEANKGYDHHPLISPDGKRLAWLSMETPGYESDKDRIMVMEFETGRVEEITKDIEESASGLCWENSNTLYFVSGVNATYQVYRANVEQRTLTQVTHGAHDYTGVIARGGVVVGRCMSMSMAPELFLINVADSSSVQITTTNKHLYDNLTFGKVEERWIRTTDGKQMLTWIIFPPGFDPEKQYPALLYCQGGPQNTVSQFWSWRWNMQLLAAQGYIVVAPNRRGVPTFGKAWLSQISGDYAGQNIQDYYSAIDALKTEKYVDAAKLGALGASYGGYSVYYIAGTHNNRFKALAAHNGMFNLESMYGTTEEMFFVNYDMGGPYWDKRPKVIAAYDKSPHKLVHRWTTPILISVGEHDYRVPYTEGLQAFSAAQLQGIPSKLLFFPDETHFVSKPQNAVVWHTELLGWFHTYLQE